MKAFEHQYSSDSNTISDLLLVNGFSEGISSFVTYINRPQFHFTCTTADDSYHQDQGTISILAGGGGNKSISPATISILLDVSTLIVTTFI